MHDRGGCDVNIAPLGPTSCQGHLEDVPRRHTIQFSRTEPGPVTGTRLDCDPGRLRSSTDGSCEVASPEGERPEQRSEQGFCADRGRWKPFTCLPSYSPTLARPLR